MPPVHSGGPRTPPGLLYSSRTAWVRCSRVMGLPAAAARKAAATATFLMELPASSKRSAKKSRLTPLRGAPAGKTLFQIPFRVSTLGMETLTT